MPGRGLAETMSGPVLRRTNHARSAGEARTKDGGLDHALLGMTPSDAGVGSLRRGRCRGRPGADRRGMVFVEEPHRVEKPRRPVPRWARLAAEAAALAPVPSSLWRLPLMFG